MGGGTDGLVFVCGLYLLDEIMTAELPAVQGAIIAPRFVSDYSSNRWITLEGHVFILAYMRTSHMFYAMRMLFDLAAKRTGRQANPLITDESCAERLAWFATDIRLRGDLPESLQPEFARMMKTLIGAEIALETPKPKEIAGNA